MKGQIKGRVFSSIAALILLWLGWTLAYLIIDNEYVLPSFSQTMVSLGGVLTRPSFYVALLNTFLRTVVSFAFSALFAVIFAVLSRLFGVLRSFFAPIISVMRSVPTMAIILILLVWMTPSSAPVAVTILVLFPTCYSAALSALDGVGEDMEKVAKVYNVPLKTRLLKMYLPVSAPAFLSQTGSFLSLGIKITVSAEVLSKTAQSIGGMMQDAKMWIEMPELLALTIVTVVLGFILEGICSLITILVVRWKR